MKAIMYHYVRPGPETPPYEYYHLALEDFQHQLDYLTETYDLIGRDEFLDCVRGEHNPPEDAVVLTFDDGLVDHYEHVLPELQDRDLWGLFFVPGPLGDDALAVHRVHTLLGTTPAEAVAEALSEELTEADLREEAANEFEGMYAESGSEEVMARVKRTLNYLLPYRKLPSVLNRLGERFPAAVVEPTDLYMNSKQLKSLANAGMLVGGHTVSHRVLSRLTPTEQRTEVIESLAYVENAVGEQPIRSFAYPYGTNKTFDEVTLASLGEADCEIAFTTEPREITGTSLAESPLQLGRYDCTEFPHGQSSTV